MNTAIARNHDQMIARPWQGRELGPFPAGGIKNFVHSHGDFVDAASTDGVNFSIQRRNADRASWAL